MGPPSKKLKKALIDKPVDYLEGGLKHVGKELSKAIVGKPDDAPKQAFAPAKPKEKSPSLKKAQSGLSANEQRLLIEKNKQFKQQEI
tara:strand:+ start:968 stop:1228 length:261 start_codon:yes stop_codon:yes gene_type:complete